jgi:hypothetical protein
MNPQNYYTVHTWSFYFRPIYSSRPVNWLLNSMWLFSIDIITSWIFFSVIMNTYSNSFYEKMNINMINAASFVRDVIQLKLICTLYIVILWNLEGSFPRKKRTHINTKPMFFCDSHINTKPMFFCDSHINTKSMFFLWFTISCMLDKYNSHNNCFRFVSLGKLQCPRKHHE